MPARRTRRGLSTASVESPRQTEPVGVALDRRRRIPTLGRPYPRRYGEKRATTVNALARIAVLPVLTQPIRTILVIIVNFILRPFETVAQHVEQAPVIRLQHPNRHRMGERVLGTPRVLFQQF